MTRQTIHRYRFGPNGTSIIDDTDLLAGFDSAAIIPDDYWSTRGRALLAAIEADPDDDEVVIGILPNGSWAVTGLTVEGYPFAIEELERQVASHDEAISERLADETFERTLINMGPRTSAERTNDMTATPNGDFLDRAAHHLGATFLGYRIDEEGSAPRIARSKEAASTAVAAAAASGHPATMTAIYTCRRDRTWYLLSDAGLAEYARRTHAWRSTANQYRADAVAGMPDAIARANEYDDLATYDDAADVRVEMPSWWSPDQREAWRVDVCPEVDEDGLDDDLSRQRFATRSDAVEALEDELDKRFAAIGEPRHGLDDDTHCERGHAAWWITLITADLITGEEVAV